MLDTVQRVIQIRAEEIRNKVKLARVLYVRIYTITDKQRWNTFMQWVKLDN
jgi:hypothetical protein